MSDDRTLVFKREASQVRAQLKALCSATRMAIDALDAEMKLPSDFERGKRIAKIMNFLEMQYDAARHFGLGESLKSDKRRKAKALPASHSERQTLT